MSLVLFCALNIRFVNGRGIFDVMVPSVLT
jgi:hypothetical protein